MKTSFYCAEHLAALDRKTGIWRAVLAFICMVTLVVFFFFILHRTTVNASCMEYCATAALVLGGWIAIAVRDCAVNYLRVLREHEARILSSEAEWREVRGLVTIEKKHVHIARSIDVRNVRVQTEDGIIRLLINDSFAKSLEKAASLGELTLRAVEGYITEVER